MPRGKGMHTDDEDEPSDKADEFRAARRADSDDETPDVDKLGPGAEPPD